MSEAVKKMSEYQIVIAIFDQHNDCTQLSFKKEKPSVFLRNHFETVIIPDVVECITLKCSPVRGRVNFFQSLKR